MLSIVLPSRNEQFLQKTIESLLKRGKDIEVIAVLDGYWPPAEEIVSDPRVSYIHFGKSRGMRAAINAGAAIAKGKYLMKLDAHCVFDQDFDQKLAENCEENWVVIPTRYSLDVEKWDRDLTRPRRDYHYLCYPEKGKQHDDGMHGVEWLDRAKGREDIMIDDNMSFQGSCWFMHKSWFTDHLEGMDENPIYGGWAQEPTEIGNKTWLGGGRVVCNKNTWYAHLHKGKTYGRGYQWDEKQIIQGHNYAADYWMNNKWEKRVHDIDWLVEKFSPVPTWPENWKEVWYGKS